MLVDVGVGVEPLLGAVELSLPTALDFADAHAVEIPVLRLEQHLAEKTHAYSGLGESLPLEFRFRETFEMVTARCVADRSCAERASIWALVSRLPLVGEPLTRSTILDRR